MQVHCKKIYVNPRSLAELILRIDVLTTHMGSVHLPGRPDLNRAQGEGYLCPGRCGVSVVATRIPLDALAELRLKRSRPLTTYIVNHGKPNQFTAYLSVVKPRNLAGQRHGGVLPIGHKNLSNCHGVNDGGAFPRSRPTVHPTQHRHWPFPPLHP